ncbi:hypothetical protein [Sphingomonas baiyangensis]|uniref:Uncharacterized protein n=1 Tax=Sphingomonas baiyangensis TaxID=2572576 RepID=A0A4U1L197_9SPHN|nr:hypothetical protein [Sphingomonas baiyangensis]TKD50601.1 hypothetical protein FBR43_07350 [Sphingomonas baiyangensis]
MIDPGEIQPPRWKQADITALRERARAVEDISAIATALGRTLSDIRRMAAPQHQMGPANRDQRTHERIV